jgi:zinc protease
MGRGPNAILFYADSYGASNGQLPIVGDFDEAEINQVLTETLGSWKGPRPFKLSPSLYQDVPPLNKSLEKSDKAGGFAEAAAAEK